MPKTITDYRKLPGVSDLDFAVGSRFAKALKLEDEGEHEKAAEWLDKAVAAEQGGD